MRVLVEVNNTQFAVPCGDGDQTLRWLGLVASQRLRLQAPQGRSRMRESADATRGFYLPQALTLLSAGGGSGSGGGGSGDDRDLSNPNARIRDVLRDGDKVQVVLQQRAAVDDIGAVKQSDWFRAGFCTGEASRRQAHGEEVRRELSRAAAEHERRRPSTGTTAAGGQLLNFNVSVTSTVKSGTLGGTLTSAPVAVTAGRAGDAAPQLADIKSALGDDAAEAKAARAVLSTPHHAATLDTVFTAFAGPAAGSGLSLQDFAHCLHAAELAHAVTDAAAIRSLFADTVSVAGLVGGGSGASAAPADGGALGGGHGGGGLRMSRAAFGMALLRMAHKQGGGGKAAATLEGLLDGQLSSLAKSITHDPVDAALFGPQLSPYLCDNRSLLQAVFLLYSSYAPHTATAPTKDGGRRASGRASTSATRRGSGGGDAGDATLSLPAYQQLMSDCGIVGGAAAAAAAVLAITSTAPVADGAAAAGGGAAAPAVNHLAALAERTFFAAQGSPKVSHELKAITFWEFIRATARLAALTTGAPSSAPPTASSGSGATSRSAFSGGADDSAAVAAHVELVLDAVIELGVSGTVGLK